MKKCIVCNSEASYKCPTCLVYYCSAACCGVHRTQKCEVVKKPTPESSTAEQNVGASSSSDELQDRMQLLGHDTCVLELLQNPHLRDMLKTIDETDDPKGSMEKAMLEPIFMEFAVACLKVLEPDKSCDT